MAIVRWREYDIISVKYSPSGISVFASFFALKKEVRA
jgi:hypothetical protein